MRSPRRVLGTVRRRLRRAGKPPLTRLGRQAALRRFREEHNRRYVPDSSGADPVLARALDDFARDGVVVVRGFLAPEVVAVMADEVRRAARPVLGGGNPSGFRILEAPGGLLRLYDVLEGPAPSLAGFLEHPFLEEFAARATSEGMHVLDEYIDIKHEVEGADTNITAHFDQWKIRLKFFLMLGDVGEEQAPFVYYPGSQRPGRWRRHGDWSYAETGVARFSEAKVAAIVRREGFERRVYTGRAGDLLIADTRGLHSASVLRAGERLQAVRLYGMNGPQSWAG